MNLGFLARGFLLKDQLHIKPCDRCGLHYDHHEPVCPHCSSLGPDALKALLREKESEREANAATGKVFLLIGVVLAAFVLIGVLSL